MISPAFENNNRLPIKYTCDGQGINPPLMIENIPSDAKSLVLIVEDPDAPSGTFDHWIVWNIPPKERIEEDSTPGVVGRNSGGRSTYFSPCPPWGTHRYIFRVYALDSRIELQSGSRRRELEKAIQSHIVAKGELVGLYR